MKPKVLTSFLLIFPLAFVYAQNIEKGLVAHWGFNNDAGTTIFDESGNYCNGVSYEVDYVDGISGKAIQFNSVKDAVFFPDKNQDAPAKIGSLSVGTISVWFNFQNAGSQVLPIFYFGEESSDKPHNSLIIEIGHGANGGDPSNRKLYFTLVNKRFCFDSNMNLSPNRWYHFVAVVDSNSNTGYLNGEELIDRKYNLGSNSDYQAFFADVPTKKMLSLGYGRFGQDDRFFHYKGMIDEVRIYDRPLTQSEVVLLFEQGKSLTGIPDFRDVLYGPFERNTLDFWQAKSDNPTPLVVFIHGGGFRSGSKENVFLPDVLQSLNHKISFAAINYRFRQTTRLDTILYDCARAIQFLRSKASEWNINPQKIAAYGGSAGGGASLWLGLVNDLANQDALDPVLRQSTKLQAIGHQNSQASYDFSTWPEILNIPENWMEIYPNTEDLELYHIENREQYSNPEIVDLRKLLDMPAHLDKNDPPVFLKNLNPLVSPTTASGVIHHPNHAIFLKNKFDALNIDACLILQSTPVEERKTVIDFFVEKFTEPVSEMTEISNFGFLIFPNPAKEIFEIKAGFEIGQMSIFNQYGIEIYSATIHANTFKISVKNWKQGVYFLRTEKGSVQKIIVR